jgi:hypothetical protein
MRFRLLSRSLLLPAGIIWVAVVAFGSATMLNYQLTPGAMGTPSRSWPGDPLSLQWTAGIRQDWHGAHLVMFAHPRCPCTRASIAELARIMAHAQTSVSASVLFYRPRPFPPGWEQTDLWRSAMAIPGVTVLADPEGREAQRFGAVTSGHVFLYDRAGNLLFTGGITGSRGHPGDNTGSDTLIRLLTRGPAAQNGHPVNRGGNGDSETRPGISAQRVTVPSAPSALAANQHTFVYGCPIRTGPIGSGE